MMRGKTAFAILASAALYLLLAAALLPELGPGAPAPTGPQWIGEALWSERGLDLIIQALILLAGSFVVVLLLREEPRGVTP